MMTALIQSFENALKIELMLKRKKRAALPLYHSDTLPAVSSSYLDLHGHARLEHHLVAVIPNHNPVKVADNQVVVESLHPPVLVQHTLRDCVPRAAEEVIVVAAGAVVRLCRRTPVPPSQWRRGSRPRLS